LWSFCRNGQGGQVEAAADAWGLKVAVVYGQVGDQLLFRNWFCNNGATLDLWSVNGQDISASGCEHLGTGQVGVNSNDYQAVMDWLNIFGSIAGAIPMKSSTHGGSHGESSTSSIGSKGSLDVWAPCKSSNQCQTGCCSGQYSEDVLKCTPVDAGYSSDICVGSAPGGRYLRVGKDWN